MTNNNHAVFCFLNVNLNTVREGGDCKINGFK